MKESVDNKRTEHRFRGNGRRAFWAIVLIGATAALLAYATGCTKYSDHRGVFTGPSPQGIQEHVKWFLKHMDATDEQRYKVEILLRNLDSDVIRWDEETRQLKSRWVQALQEDQVNEKDFGTIKLAALSLADEVLSQAEDTSLKLSEVLTPDQRKELLLHWKSHQ